MKKTWLAAALAVAIVQPAFAENGPGCGVGATVFKGQSGVGPHVLAATTNGTFFQTFSMTTGLMGCQPNTKITIVASLFIDQNMDQLARDMSRGQGEHLDALASILKIEGADRSAFNLVVQENFDSIFGTSDATASEVVDNLVSVMQQDPALIKYLG